MTNCQFEKITQKKILDLKRRLNGFTLPAGIWAAIDWKGNVQFTRQHTCKAHKKVNA